MTPLLHELKRRHVPRVVLVYGASAVAVVQAADVIFPRLGLPSWTVTAVVWSAVIGLPVAAALAWLFDLTPGGIHRAPDASPPGAAPPAWVTPRTAIVVVLLLLVTAGTGWWAGRTVGAVAVEDATRSIAVLPFAITSGRAEDAPFAEGLADELLNVLGRINGLKVAARTSSFAFRDEADVRMIGDSLGVQSVLEGTVRREGERVRVSATLINVADGMRIWSEQYDDDLSQVFVVQERLARAIARELELRLGNGAVVAGRSTDPQALEAYLRGLARFRDRASADDVRAAIAEFQHAVSAHPDFAEAWGGLALAYAVLPGFDTVSVTTTAPRVREYAARASRLDDRLATPYAALCESLGGQEWRWAEAEQACRASIARNGSFETAHAWLGALLAMQARFEESDVAFGRALMLDPRSPIIHQMAGVAAFSARDLPRAEHLIAESLRLDPAQNNLPSLLGAIRILRGDFAGARAVFLAATPGNAAEIDAYLEGVRNPVVREAMLPAIRALVDSTITNWATYAALSLAFFGDTASAIRYVQRAHERREFTLAMHLSSPVLDAIRDDPRFRAVVAAMHLDPEALARARRMQVQRR